MLIEITGHQLYEGTKVSTLTWIQELVVKWFKLEIVQYYSYLSIIKTNDTRVHENDIVISDDGTRWLVLTINEGEIFCKTVDILKSDPVIGKYLTMYGNARLEKRCETSEEFFKSN
jgi:hypothetical protein